MAQRVGQGVTGARGAGAQHEAVRDAAFGQTVSRGGGGGTGGGDAGDDLHRDAAGTRSGKFLPRAAEDARIAGFQTHHATALQRLGGDDVVDALLWPGMGADDLAHEDPFGIAAGQLQHVLADQPVVEDHVRLLQPLHRAQGQQVARAGARADQRDGTESVALEFAAAPHRGLYGADGVMLLPRDPFAAGFVGKDPAPEGATVLARDVAGHRVAHPAREGGEPAQRGGQRSFDLGLDLAGEDGGGTLGSDGDNDRVAVHQRGGGDVAQIRPVHHVDGAARGDGQRVDRGVVARTARRDESHGGPGEGRLAHRTVMPFCAATGCERLQLRLQRRGGEDDARIGLEDQAGLLCGLLAASDDDDAATAGADEHGKALHRRLLRWGYSAATRWVARAMRSAISGRHEPQLVPAPRAVPMASTLSNCWVSMARRIVFIPTDRHAQRIGPGSG